MKIRNSPQHYITGKMRRIMPSESAPPRAKRLTGSSKFDRLQPTDHNSNTNETLSTDALMHMMRPIQGKGLPKFHMQQLMLHAISTAAIATFKSSSLDILARDGYVIDECGQPRAKTFVYADSLQYRVRHQASSFRTALGHVWVRTTTIKSTDGSTVEACQTVTSFVFYPTFWLKCLGFQQGLEAVVSSAGQSWLLNCRITVTHAIPGNSLIFDLCRTGQTRAVGTLFEKGLASVVDTSPKGWKPLHVRTLMLGLLCPISISLLTTTSVRCCRRPCGALHHAHPRRRRQISISLRRAIRVHPVSLPLLLHLPKPASDIPRSPISLFVACSPEMHAETKIKMLRMFYDCIDLTTPEGDGWQVHEWLKRAYATEKVPISQNSITWLLHLTANEQYVECSPRIVWSGLQHAVRSVLTHERYNGNLQCILQRWNTGAKHLDQQQVSALSAWIALRVTGRMLLHMAIHAGSFLQMQGFDWVEDYLPYRLFLKAQPNLYAAWCHAVLDAVENIAEYMHEQQLCWTQEDLLNALSNTEGLDCTSSRAYPDLQTCSRCKYNYGAMANSLVEPARLAIQECVRTGHDAGCACRVIPTQSSTSQLPVYTGTCSETSQDDNSDADEAFFDAQPQIFDMTSLQIQENGSVFSDTATLLYRAQGRTWIGSYALGERLCSSCFLLRERYIGEDGFAAEFAPMPESFVSRRTKW